jgi:hypothetical protein
MMAMDQLMQMQRCRARSFEPVSKIKTEFRGQAREQSQYWIKGQSLHTGDTGIKPPGTQKTHHAGYARRTPGCIRI